MWNPDFTVENTILTIVSCLIFLVGLFINMKIVLKSLKDKSTKTWQIEIVYSISLTICSAFHIPFSAISHATENLLDYTGVWFCHIATFLHVYGIYIAAMSSLIVVIMKYIFIVHPHKSLKWGHEKIQKIFLVIYLALPFLLSTLASLIKPYTNKTLELVLDRCFGLKPINSAKTWQSIFLCNLKASETDEPGIMTSKIMIQVACVFSRILTFMLLCNITEILFYHLIFKTMKRFVYIYIYI